MKKPMAKAKVVSLNGQAVERATVTQLTLAELEIAQRAAWSAHVRAVELAKKIKTALAEGAKEEAGRLYFDVAMEMVRSRKRREATGR